MTNTDDNDRENIGTFRISISPFLPLSMIRLTVQPRGPPLMLRDVQQRLGPIEQRLDRPKNMDLDGAKI